ncbi:hypothetical protein G9E11_06370 [Arthrobacter sp. IA7]|uniref:hypothetical protein n=1 Tax=Arthrobacter ipis TaxID=2716202 RepID=UPI001682445E|nr:hypothetical protein [Arthrobacter ipis]MBD1541879.1 hypothetical protein [Arthrobacter ipis]
MSTLWSSPRSVDDSDDDDADGSSDADKLGCWVGSGLLVGEAVISRAIRNVEVGDAVAVGLGACALVCAAVGLLVWVDDGPAVGLAAADRPTSWDTEGTNATAAPAAASSSTTAPATHAKARPRDRVRDRAAGWGALGGGGGGGSM